MLTVYRVMHCAGEVSMTTTAEWGGLMSPCRGGEEGPCLEPLAQ